MIILSVRAFKFNTCSSLCLSFMCRLIINEGNNILSGSTLQAMVITSKGIHRRENHNVWFGIEEIPLQVSMVKTSPGIWSESFRRNLLDFTQLVAPYLDPSNPSASSPPPPFYPSPPTITRCAQCNLLQPRQAKNTSGSCPAGIKNSFYLSSVLNSIEVGTGKKLKDTRMSQFVSHNLSSPLKKCQGSFRKLVPL